MESKYNVKSFCIPFGYEPHDKIEQRVADEVVCVCFIGNGDKLRLNFLNQLAQKGLKIHVYGLYWNSKKLHSNIELFPPVYGDDFVRHIRKYRVQLNLMRIHNPSSHNMRTFEIPGYGAIQLAPSTPDHIQYFKNDEEIFVYESLEDCFRKATKILHFSKEVAQQHQSSAYHACINKGYSYRNRAIQMTELITKMQSTAETAF